MPELNNLQLVPLGHAHAVWLHGLRAGRDSMYLCQSLEEAEAQSPYLVDGKDPIDRILKKEEA